MAQLKSTSVTGNLSVTGNILASKIIKLDGTTHEVLLADGTVAKVSTAAQTVAPNAVTATAARTYIVQKNGDQLVVNVPWVKGESSGGTLTEVNLVGGGGITLSSNTIDSDSDSITISHADTSSQASMTTGGRTYINSITLDGYGHVTALGTNTETVTDTGATSIEVTGSGNAVTTASYDSSTRKITLTKGTTFLTSHQSLDGYLKGSGTANYIPKFTATDTVGNSEIIDNGSNVYPSANLGNALGHVDYNWDKVFVRQVELNRAKGASYGRINFYSPTYYTWYEYMSNPGVASPTGANTTTYGGVTSWARRSLIESTAGYGWIWESCTNSANVAPTPRMSLSSNTGALTVSGDVSTPGLAITSSTVEKAKWKYNSADDCIELTWS